MSDFTLRPNKGSAFKPRDNEKVIALGSINQGADEIPAKDCDKVLITRTTLPDGRKFHDVYVQAGKLFDSAETANKYGRDKPAYAMDGSFLDKKIFIYFNKSNNGTDYMGLSLTESTNEQPKQYEQVEHNDEPQNNETLSEEDVDEIPF